MPPTPGILGVERREKERKKGKRKREEKRKKEGVDERVNVLHEL